MRISCVGCQCYPAAQAMLTRDELPNICLEVEPENIYDSKAVRFHVNGETIGHVPKRENVSVGKWLKENSSKGIGLRVADIRYDTEGNLQWFTVDTILYD